MGRPAVIARLAESFAKKVGLVLSKDQFRKVLHRMRVRVMVSSHRVFKVEWSPLLAPLQTQ